jgi:hypothetical protein
MDASTDLRRPAFNHAYQQLSQQENNSPQEIVTQAPPPPPNPGAKIVKTPFNDGLEKQISANNLQYVHFRLFVCNS